MFEHSVKVPRLYKTAAKLAKDVQAGKGSIKQLVYEGKHPNIKALYALIVHAFQKSLEIDELLKKSKLLVKENRFDPWLARILITELLWGKKRLTGDSKPVKTILAYEQILKAHLTDSFRDVPDFDQVEKPRYVRVNTLKISISEAVDAFRDEGWILKRYNIECSYEEYIDIVASLTPEEFLVDIHIPELLVFPPKTQFYKHGAYKNGSIILQDKASCLPVHLLRPEPGSVVLDMCAAPGMKTTQTAARIENNGTVYAVELNRKRFNILNSIVESAGATCVKTLNQDVTTITNRDCPDVDYILVDPSCSGSGITDRVEVGQQLKDQDQQRLSKLSSFQIMSLRRALTIFSKAKRVVYSTCSIYPEENEDVVRQVLETTNNFKLVNARECLKSWTNVGSSEFRAIGDSCLYAKTEIDLTNGFFVAVFERLQPGEQNELFNVNLARSQIRIFDGTFSEDIDSKLTNDEIAYEATNSLENIKEENEMEDKGKNKKKRKIQEDTLEENNQVESDIKITKKKKISTQDDNPEDNAFKPVNKKHKKETVSEDTEIRVKKKKITRIEEHDANNSHPDLSDIKPLKIKKKKIKLENDEGTVENEEIKVVKKKKRKRSE